MNDFHSYVCRASDDMARAMGRLNNPAIVMNTDDDGDSGFDEWFPWTGE